MTGEQIFRLPDLGEGLTEAEIITWRVAEGDEVRVDDIVVDLETAKAVVEVPCPFAGTVATLHGSTGDTLAVGEPLLTITPSIDPTTRAHDTHREEERAGSGAVLVGYGTAHGARSDRRRSRRGRRGVPATSGAADRADNMAATAPANGRTPAAPRVISPVVRRLAREAGLDLAAIAGSGPAGIIVRRDIDAAAASIKPAAVAATTGTAAAEGDTVPGRRGDAGLRDERIPLRGLRRTVADKLSRSRREIPDATTWVDVDATELVAAREAMRDTGVGLLALLARFVVAGLERYPELNSSVDGDEIVRHGHIHLGFAAQTDRGLVVPVVRDAHRMTTARLGAEIARLTTAARDGTLEPAELTGGTITLNNYGVFGVDGSTPIINHPEAALLGVGRIVDKPWVVDGQLAVRKVTQLSLTFDHRVCDGGTAGGFLLYVADCVERPVSLLADL